MDSMTARSSAAGIVLVLLLILPAYAQETLDKANLDVDLHAQGANGPLNYDPNPGRAVPTLDGGWAYDEVSDAFVDSDDSPYVFTLPTCAWFRITDCFQVDDVYYVYDSGELILTTEGFSGSAFGNDEAADSCWEDPAFTGGELWLLAGDHSLTIQGDGAGGLPAGFYTRLDSAGETEPPTIDCDAVGGEVNDNCQFLVTFSATITDDLCVRPEDVDVEITLPTGNATLGTETIDVVQGASDGEVLVSGSVLVFNLTGCPATVQVTVDAVDCCGNIATQCVATANVVDVTSPVLTCPDSITLDRGDKICGSGVEDWLNSAVATDNCDMDVTIVNDSADNGFECGFPYSSSTDVTWTATDECGNVSETCSATITIKPPRRVDMSRKGSLLIYSKVDLRWRWNEGLGQWDLIQDTFIELTSDRSDPFDETFVQVYFVNGDPPLGEIPGTERAHKGWNWEGVSHALSWKPTHGSPIYWSAATGFPGFHVSHQDPPPGDPNNYLEVPLSPFTILDPADYGTPTAPGRPDPEGMEGDRMLRGYILVWVIDNQGREIRFNHLQGKGMIVNYANQTAWEYAPWAFTSNCVGMGEQPLDCIDFDDNGVCCEAEVIPGRLDTDAFQYAAGFTQLLLDFFATGGAAFTKAEDAVILVDTDLTLLPISVDLTQESGVIDPVVTKAKFDVWSMNEIKFSGTHRCVTGWDQALLSSYDAPNHFLIENLHTDKGKARIDGLASAWCEDSVAEPLLGVSAKLLFDEGDSVYDFWTTAGTNLVGMGTQSAQILFDVTPVPPELAD